MNSSNTDVNFRSGPRARSRFNEPEFQQALKYYNRKKNKMLIELDCTGGPNAR
jgi:hypothetical protein